MRNLSVYDGCTFAMCIGDDIICGRATYNRREHTLTIPVDHVCSIVLDPTFEGSISRDTKYDTDYIADLR